MIKEALQSSSTQRFCIDVLPIQTPPRLGVSLREVLFSRANLFKRVLGGGGALGFMGSETRDQRLDVQLEFSQAFL